jgi:hypothetical protein
VPTLTLTLTTPLAKHPRACSCARRHALAQACRTHLHVAVSRDQGASWHYVAHVEREETDGVRIHYPSLLQRGNYLYVMYSRFYLDLGRCKTMLDKLACNGLRSSNQGIKLARADLAGLSELPQVRTLSHTPPSAHVGLYPHGSQNQTASVLL